MTWKNFSRRQFAKHMTILGALPLSARSLSAVPEVAPLKPPAPPEVKSYPGILRHRVVFWDPYGYSAWPTILQCRDGEMLIAFCESHATERPIDPCGSLVIRHDHSLRRSG